MLPQYPARWNRALLGKDAVCWHAHSLLTLDAAGARILGSNKQLVDLDATPKGSGAKWVNAADCGVSFGAVQSLKATDGYSFLVVANPVASGTVETYFSQRASSGSPRVDLVSNTNASGGTEAGTILLRITNTTTANKSMSVLSQTDGTVHTWTGYHNSANTGKAWRDGAPQTVTPNAALSGTLWDSSQETRIGNIAATTSTGGVVDSQVMLMVIMWPRQVDDALLQMLSRNPERAFMQLRRNAKAILFPTLSAATVTNITGTTATPRVTVTFP